MTQVTFPTPVLWLLVLNLSIGLLPKAASARVHGQRAAQDTAFATLQGVVLDSLNGGLLAGAAVHLTVKPADTLSHRAATDDNGFFRAERLPPGKYAVSVRHAVLDSLGILGLNAHVDLERGETANVELGVPSGSTFLARLCPAGPSDQDGEAMGGVFGVVRDIETNRPVPGASVRLLWRDLLLDPTLGLRWSVEFRDATSDPTGVYVVCDTPPEVDAHLIVEAAEYDTAGAYVPELPESRLALQHIQLGRSGMREAIVRGSVMGQGGNKVEGADVGVVDLGGVAVNKTAVTDEAGAFVARGLRAGTQVFEVNRIGFLPTRQTVTVHPGNETSLAIAMMERPIELPAIVATTTADRFGFADRRRRGGGLFYTRQDIAQKQLMLAIDLVRQTPLLKVEQQGATTVITNTSLRQNIKGQTCQMATFVNGVPALPDFVLNISAHDLDGVEIYNTPESVPSEFAAPQSTCGAILVWTNWQARRGKTPK